MKTIKFIAAWALITLASSSFGHEKAAHGTPEAHSAATTPSKEQKDWGIAGDPRNVRRTITIEMADTMRFTPNQITVREGDTVRLRAANRGRVLHEIVIGTRAELQAHAELMKKHPGMEHDAPYMAHVAAGQKGDMVWQFNRAGQFDFSCLIPGHLEAGMTGTITVLPRKS